MMMTLVNFLKKEKDYNRILYNDWVRFKLSLIILLFII